MEDRLAQLINWVQEAEESSDNARKNAERDRDYYDNIQWTSSEVAELKKRKQPIITINRVKRKVDFLTGIEKQQRTDPKAFPRNPADQEAANAASDSIRYVEERNKFDGIASQVWENMLVEGFGGCEIGVVMKREPEIYIKHQPWDRIFFDPYSTKKDFSDARYKGGIIWTDIEQAIRKWPDSKDVLEATLSEGQTSDTFDDKPKHTVWADSKRKRVKIVQMWFREGEQWFWCLFTKAGKIAAGESPYRTQEGESLCGLILRSAYVDRENNRYGAVREMISPQDEINKRRSKLLHQLNQRQTIADKSAVEDVRKLKAELAKPDGHVQITSPNAKFEILNNNDQISGQFNLLQEAKQEIDLMGPNASMTGKSDKGVESGRAIQAQQQGGFIELATLLDGYREFKQEVYEMIWHLVRQYWTEEKWIRVTDDENNVKFVGLNRPIPVGEVGGYPKELIDQHPQLQQPSGQIENEVARLDVDIMIEEAPDSLTIQHEEFQEIVNLVQSGVPIPPDMLIEMSQIRNKQKIIERLQGGGDPEQVAAQQEEAQKQQQIQEAAIQLEFEQKAKDIEKTDAEIRKIHADAAETETEIIAPDPGRFNADAGLRAR